MSDIAGAVSRLNNYVSTAGGMGMETQVSHDIALILAEMGSGAGEPVYVPHKFWGAGEADCPKDIKSSNGELHTLRCKVCGKDNNKEPCSVTRPPVAGLADSQIMELWQAMNNASKYFCSNNKVPINEWAVSHEQAVLEAAREFLGKVDG